MQNTRLHDTTRLLRSGLTAALIIMLLSPLFFPSAAAAQTASAGYRAFSFPAGTGVDDAPTGEKPESKLWWVDGFWYGSLWSRGADAYTIHRFNPASQSWTDTGVRIDDRLGSKADALWDGTRLFIVSHLFVENNAGPNDSGGRLYVYSYNSSTRTFSLNSGFPVEVNNAITETLVVDKDSSGQLWITYVEGNRVMVNRSTSSDYRTWGTPFALPAGGMENVTADDISSLITYNNYVGVMWSRQTNPRTIFFAVHAVGAADTSWSHIRSYTVSGDDHINLKSLQSDDAGNLFAVVKTEVNSALIVVLVCRSANCQSESDWSPYIVYDSVAYNPTRPMMVIDESNRHLYVFTRNEPSGSGRGGIYYKRADLDKIAFDPGALGTPFINNSDDTEVNDPTGSKHNVNAATGLLILASDHRTNYYLHNYISLGSTAPPGSYSLNIAAQGSGTVSMSPSLGSYLPGTQVTLTAHPASGWVFSGWQGDLSGSTNPASLTMDGNKAVLALFYQPNGGGSYKNYIPAVVNNAGTGP